MCENIRDALNLTFYEQHHDDTLSATRGSPCVSIWIIWPTSGANSTRPSKKMKDHFYRDWTDDKHITAYDARVAKEHGELKENGITITINENDVVEHYVLQMYKRGDFDRWDMTTYEAKADDQKTLELTMIYFEGLIATQEEFE